MDIHVKFGDSTLNSGRINRLFAGRTRFTHFCAVFNCVWQPTESSDIWWSAVLDKLHPKLSEAEF